MKVKMLYCMLIFLVICKAIQNDILLPKNHNIDLLHINPVFLSRENTDNHIDIENKEDKLETYEDKVVKFSFAGEEFIIYKNNDKCIPDCYINCESQFTNITNFKYCLTNLCLCKQSQYQDLNQIEKKNNDSYVSNLFLIILMMFVIFLVAIALIYSNKRRENKISITRESLSFKGKNYSLEEMDYEAPFNVNIKRSSI